MTAVQFVIHVPDQRLERLRQKLALADFPDGGTSDLANSWDQGPPVAEVKRLARLWQDSYDWRKVEAHLNSFPQFLLPVEVDGFGVYKIHHIHQRSIRSDAIPLLFLHGWPGSFLEVTKVISDLVHGAPDSPSFHVIAPSLIDFGFSSASGKRGFQMEHHAEAYDKLMRTLGYDEYVIQGGDLGHLIARFMARQYGPSRCKAYHINTTAPAQPDPETATELHEKFLSTPLTAEERRGLGRAATFGKEGMGYYKQLSTKPLTIGYAVKDSPVALLAWIYEKLRDWSDNYKWTDEEILTWVSIYYFSTPGPEAAGSVYYAMEHSEPTAFASQQSYIDVPFGVARFYNDLALLPKLWNQTLGPVVFESEYETGGHFAAWERPDAIVKDLRSMFDGDRRAYGFLRSPGNFAPQA